MALEETIDKVELIEKLDPEGTYLLVRHRGEYFQISVSPTDDEDNETFYRKFLDYEVYSEVLQMILPIETVIFLSGKVPEKFREAIIAHEIGESIYNREGLSRKEAHNYGVRCEDIYTGKFFDEKTREKYLKWRKENFNR